MVKTLLANGANANLRTQNGKFPVHLAAQYGNLEVLQDLLGHGCELNAKTSKSQWSPLHWASSEGKAAVVEYLLSQGATADIKDKVCVCPSPDKQKVNQYKHTPPSPFP